MPQFLEPCARETQLSEQHFRLMRDEDHDGFGHCKCAVAVELKQLSDARWVEIRKLRQAIIDKRKAAIARKKMQANDIQGVGC